VLRDPRGRELELLSAQSKLRQKSLDAESRPTLTVESMAQYLSDVPRLPFSLPGGVSLNLPHDVYDAHVAAQQRLYDPALAPRRAVEDAQLAESQARLRVSLFGLRQNVNDAFFASLRAQEQIFPFLNAHYAYALCRAGKDDDVRRLRQCVGAFAARQIGDRAKAWQGTGVPLVDASIAMARGDADAACALLDPVVGEIGRVGGSDAQDDLFRYAHLVALIDAREEHFAGDRAAVRAGTVRRALEGLIERASAG